MDILAAARIVGKSRLQILFIATLENVFYSAAIEDARKRTFETIRYWLVQIVNDCSLLVG